MLAEMTFGTLRPTSPPAPDLGVQISRGWDDALISDDRGWDSKPIKNPMHGWNPESLARRLRARKRTWWIPSSSRPHRCAVGVQLERRVANGCWSTETKTILLATIVFCYFLMFFFFFRGFMPNHIHNTVSSRDRYLGTALEFSHRCIMSSILHQWKQLNNS